MKQIAVFSLALFFLSLGVGIGDAEAARFGGGRSFGAQRSVTPRPMAPQRQVAPAPTRQSTGTPTQATAPRRSWLGPLAGLAAGLGLGALMSHFGLGGGLGNLIVLALLVMGGLFVFRRLFRGASPSATTNETMRFAGVDRIHSVPQPDRPQPTAASAMPAENREAGDSPIPAGFDVEAFLRVAKVNFIRLQAANDAKNLDDIREFVSPEVFAEVKMQMDERGNTPQQTDVVTLEAELLEVVTETTRHIASVRFSGMLRESSETAVPFAEIWHLSKPVSGTMGWVVAGIQQVA